MLSKLQKCHSHFSGGRLGFCRWDRAEDKGRSRKEQIDIYENANSDLLPRIRGLGRLQRGRETEQMVFPVSNFKKNMLKT